MRRRGFQIEAPGGGGLVSGIEFGPDEGRLDVLFLHANGFNALTYRNVMAELGPGVRLLAVDLRGHGRTMLPVPEAHPGWQIYADDLVALVAALGETPRILAGHSMGAATAMLAAPSLPGVERLMLFEPVIVPEAVRAAAGAAPMYDQPMAQAALRRRAGFATLEDAFDAYDGRGAFRSWQEGMLRDYLEDGLIPAEDGGLRLACSPAWEAANFAAFGMADPVAGLVASRVPAMIFVAAHGSTCGLDLAALKPAARRRVTMATLPGTSHFLPMERPGIVCKALVEALAG
jgi:pimeloyl-ACP methyl ester carboxylesterase